MKVFTVHTRRGGLDPDRAIVLVKEGFSWPAFFFSFAWALWCRLWFVALGIFLLEVAVNAALSALGADPVSQAAVSLGLAAAIGLVGNDLKRWTLARRGYIDTDIVTGEGADGAERRFFDRHPEFAAELAR
jgi:Protein of unknown function (DUF2628)